jgi:hypothetical protein
MERLLQICWTASGIAGEPGGDTISRRGEVMVAVESCCIGILKRTALNLYLLRNLRLCHPHRFTLPHPTLTLLIHLIATTSHGLA